MVSRLMEKGSWLIKALTFDAHNSNAWIREVLFGQFQTIKHSDIQCLPWFSELKFRDLPSHCLPYLPLKICTHDDVPVWALCGPCSFDSNCRGMSFNVFYILLLFVLTFNG